MKTAYIVSSVRTAVGKAKKGKLQNTRPDDLGAIAVKKALEEVSKLPVEKIDDVLMGCAFPQAEQGMNVARITAMKAGLPDTIPGATINRFCASGIQAIASASQTIMTGQANAIIAGGTESMSLIPMGGHYFMPNPDLVEQRPEVYITMGLTAENVAAKYHIPREEQDAFALRSHQRAIDAIQNGRFRDEIAPVELKEKFYNKGKVINLEENFEIDEGPRKDTSLESLAKLRPAFHALGSVTAGNSSQMSDGAAASIIMSESFIQELDIQPMAKFLGYAVGGVAPEIMGVGPIVAVPKVLQLTGIKLSDIGLIELNEAFAAQSLAVIKELDLKEDIVNVNGGAIALGHPLGCTGAKLTTTLLHEMIRRKVRYGLVTMCIGGGMGAAGIFENMML